MSESAVRVGDFAVRFALSYGWIDADICHSVSFKEGEDKRVIGTVLKGLEKKGFLKATRYKRSKRAKCHHRPIIHYEVRR